MLHNYSTKAYRTFEVKLTQRNILTLFQIEILPKMLIKKRKRTDLNQARKRLLVGNQLIITGPESCND